MFTFKPASKNSSNGNGSNPSNGASNANEKSPDTANDKSSNQPNGNTALTAHAPLSGWLGLGNGHKNGANRPNGNGHSNKIESVLGPGVNFQGKISGAGGVRIEGTFDGDINVKGQVVVADGAKVTADIHAFAVSVAGSVQGNITAEKVDIRSTGRIFGDLVTTAFATEEGAFLRGQVRMEDEIPAPAPAQLEAPATMPIPMPATAAMVEPDESVKIER